MTMQSEQFFRAIFNSGIDISDNEAVQAFIGQYNSNLGIPGDKAPADEAFDLCCQAEDILRDDTLGIETAKVLRLYRKAVKLDPHCYDAQIAVIELTATDDLAVISKLEKLEAEARQHAVDELDLEGSAPEAWYNWELRPYLRLCQVLFDEYVQAGQYTKAIAMGERLLGLCEADNLGMRMRLMPIYVMLERFDEAEALYKRFRREPNAWFLLSMSVLHFKQGSAAKARTALKSLEQNCPGALEVLCEGPGEREIPDAYRPGTAEEMDAALTDVLPLLATTPAYIDWLVKEREAIGARSSPKAVPGGKKKSK